MEINIQGSLHKTTRDDEDETTVIFKFPASEFQEVCGIPAQQLLKIRIETE